MAFVSHYTGGVLYLQVRLPVTGQWYTHKVLDGGGATTLTTPNATLEYSFKGSNLQQSVQVDLL